MSHASSTRLTIKELLILSRPNWWVAAAVPFVAGYLVADGLHLSWPLAIGALYFLTAYNILLYGINDITYHDADLHNPRKTHVLPKTKHRQLWWAIAFTNVPFLAYFVLLGTVASGVFLGVMVLMAVSYSARNLRFKEVPVLDSITSAFHYTSPFIFGVLLAGSTELWLPAWMTFFLWAMGNHAFGAIQDIKADREAGVTTVATKLGSERTLVFCLSLYVAAMVLPVLEYGAKGLLVSLVLFMYVALAANTIPKRANPEHSIFRQSWHLLTFLNYLVGALVIVYLLTLAKLD